MVFNSITTFGDPAGPPNMNGPLADLNQPDYTYNLYQYPSAQDPNSTGHMIVFFVNIPQESYWNNSGSTNSNAPQPVANRNGAASNFALRNASLGSPGQELSSGNLGSSINNLALQSRTTRTTSAIGLYIPPTMLFTQSMQYDTISLTAGLGLIADAFGASDASNHGKWKESLASIGSILPQVSKNTRIGGQLGVLGGARDAGLAALGIADNPQNFLLFKQIDFRHFNFSFILTPENQGDTSVINQIIKLFRFHSAPEVDANTAGRFFVPPSQFDIQVMYKGQLNPNIPLINTCVCNKVSVNYAEAGKWVTYTDGQPVMIKLDLDFTEMNILTKDLVDAGF